MDKWEVCIHTVRALRKVGMSLKIIGPHPFENDSAGNLKTRIGTLFTDHEVLYTASPWVHAMQRAAFLDLLNEQRAARGAPRLTYEEEAQVVASSVDLIFEPGHILIRPDPERMQVAFVADELLQGIVFKKDIKFLSVSDARVREAIQHRGENWRLSGIPTTLAEKQEMIFRSRVAIRGSPIYFYNRFTGTRWLTFESFEKLGELEPEKLALHLDEIASHITLTNMMGRPEVALFAADVGGFDSRNFSAVSWTKLPLEELRTHYERLRVAFRSTVHEGYRKDSCSNKAWCDLMLFRLFLDGNEYQADETSNTLSPEFFAQVRWVPGGRIEEGEFLLDPIFEEQAKGESKPQQLCDERAKGIIFNFLREYGDLEFINVGLVSEPLNKRRPQVKGLRGVYIAEFRSRSQPVVIRRLLRLQKWDVTQHLDQGKDMLQAIRESEEYTDYWLDRRLGSRQLGMSVNRRVSMHRLTEKYRGSNPIFFNQTIRTTYFEREFLNGTASDKIKPEKYDIPGYAERLAEVLGKAAGTSLIIGRALEGGSQPVFDDGDELIVEGQGGLPESLFVADHSGSFGEYQLPLTEFAHYYAGPVNYRSRFIKDLRTFAEIYLTAMEEQLNHIQQDYRKRRRAFDNLFRHCKYDKGGSFAYRWECVLKRLDDTDMADLVRSIRSHITILQEREPAAASRSLQESAPAVSTT